MKKCILIFDDDPQLLTVCRIIFERFNYRVATRAVCDNVILDMRSEKPDVVLMDLWIPIAGGEAAINLIKNNPQTKNIPVILFSANDEIKTIASRANASGFLKKPFEISEMLAIVEKFTHNVLES